MRQIYTTVHHQDDDEYNDPQEYDHGHHHRCNGSSSRKTAFSLGVAFWLLGLLNNSSYVIMIASAKTISEGGTALVFLANIIPSMLIKLTAPYWFDHVSYKTRMILAFLFMVLSFGLVGSLSGDAVSATTTTTTFQLIGVALGSAQSGLGEASLLAAAGKCDLSGEGKCISWFSSGTGLAGVFGFLWKFVWNEWLRLSMSTTLWLAQLLALLYIGIFCKFLQPHLLLNNTNHQYALAARTSAEAEERQPLELTTYHDHSNGGGGSTLGELPSLSFPTTDKYEDPLALPTETDTTTPQPTPVHEMSFCERVRLVMSLWPYIIPLFVVYAAEYSLQAGTWTAIGFPTSQEEARDEFYEYSNWMYQAGVFVSRSSGSLGVIAPMTLLWLMPTLQVANVVFFAIVAAHHVWYSYAQLLPICFYVGLLGGAVYVHGYMRICADFARVDRREFALAATSVAESLGIVVADVLGLFIQSCLYRTNNIDGAVVSCPISAQQ